MKRGNFLGATLLAFFALTGCKPSDLPAQPHQQVEATPPSKAATPDDWRAALSTAYVESGLKDEGDGVTSFMAGFRRDDRKSGVVFGRRDAFRKLRFFTPGIISNMGPGALCPFLMSYIALPDNRKPVIFLRPCYSGTGWIFMNKVSILLDGELGLEADFSGAQVHRDTSYGGVVEYYDSAASDDQIAGLRKISSSSKAIVRLTGSKGYITVPAKYLREFKDEIATLLIAYDALNTALDGSIPPPSK